MCVAGKDLTRVCATLLRRNNTRLAGGAVGITGIDEHGAQAMLAAFQMALPHDQRRGDYFVAGKHSGRRDGLAGHRAGKIGITAGF